MTMDDLNSSEIISHSDDADHISFSVTKWILRLNLLMILGFVVVLFVYKLLQNLGKKVFTSRDVKNSNLYGKKRFLLETTV